MASIEHAKPSDGVLVLVLRPFVSERGQEFLPGMRAGFTAAAAQHLVAKGLASLVTEPAPQAAPPAAEPIEVKTEMKQASLSDTINTGNDPKAAPAAPRKPRV